MLQGHIHVGADLFVLRDCVQQLAGNLVGIGVEETHPTQVFDRRKFFQQKREAIFQAEIFAIASGVLADQGNFSHSGLRETFGLGNDGFKTSRAELSAQLRNDAEGAGMIAALGNLDVGHVAAASRGCAVSSS